MLDRNSWRKNFLGRGNVEDQASELEITVDMGAERTEDAGEGVRWLGGCERGKQGPACMAKGWFSS